MRTKSIFLFFLIFSFLCVVTAGEKPDFSGEWKINKEKSDTGGMERFIPSKVIIKQSAEKITVDRVVKGMDGGDMVMSLTVTLDGKECKDEVWGGSPRVSTAAWGEGDVLTINSKITFNRDGNTFDMNSKSVYSMKDGMLVLDSSFDSPNGQQSMKLLFDKEEAKASTAK